MLIINNIYYLTPDQFILLVRSKITNKNSIKDERNKNVKEDMLEMSKKYNFNDILFLTLR